MNSSSKYLVKDLLKKAHDAAGNAHGFLSGIYEHLHFYVVVADEELEAKVKALQEVADQLQWELSELMEEMEDEQE